MIAPSAGARQRRRFYIPPDGDQRPRLACVIYALHFLFDGAPKLSGNLFADYSYPLPNGKVFRVNLNYNYTSSYYPDQTLSR